MEQSISQRLFFVLIILFSIKNAYSACCQYDFCPHVRNDVSRTSVGIFPSWATGRSCRYTPAAAASLSQRCRRSHSSTPGWQPEPGSHPVTPETTGPFGWCNSQTCSPVLRSGEGPPWTATPKGKTHYNWWTYRMLWIVVPYFRLALVSQKFHTRGNDERKVMKIHHSESSLLSIFLIPQVIWLCLA